MGNTSTKTNSGGHLFRYLEPDPYQADATNEEFLKWGLLIPKEEETTVSVWMPRALNAIILITASASITWAVMSYKDHPQDQLATLPTSPTQQSPAQPSPEIKKFDVAILFNERSSGARGGGNAKVVTPDNATEEEWIGYVKDFLDEGKFEKAIFLIEEFHKKFPKYPNQK